MRRTERLLAGLLWLSLGVSKVIDPTAFVAFVGRELDVGSPASALAAWASIGFEVLLGVALLGTLNWRRSVPALSAAVASALLLYTALSPPGADCGCFGGIVEATRSSRLVVSAALVFLSAGALRAELIRQIGVDS